MSIVSEKLLIAAANYNQRRVVDDWSRGSMILDRTKYREQCFLGSTLLDSTKGFLNSTSPKLLVGSIQRFNQTIRVRYQQVALIELHAASDVRRVGHNSKQQSTFRKRFEFPVCSK